MKLFALLLVAFVLCLAPADTFAQKIVKETLQSPSGKRTYYLFVPEGVDAGKRAPLVVLLHGSNRNGLTLVEKWKDLAKKEGIIIVGPDAENSAAWSIPNDGPDPLHELVEALKAKHPIDARRVYLFGHSAGAGFALMMSLFESQYFAATAVHAGALRPGDNALIELAKRKTPISIQVGTNDAFFPLSVVRATRDALIARGFTVELTEIKGHTHWYYDLAPKINLAAWEFLRKHTLAEDPQFETHTFRAAGKEGKKTKQPEKQPEAVNDNPTEAESKSTEASAAYNRGLELQRAGDPDAAIVAYTRALELTTDFADAHNNRGAAHLSKKNYAAAITDLTRSIELKPADAAYANRGAAYQALKKTAEAIADYTKAINLNPTAGAYFNRGIAYEETSERDRALADYTRAIELDPKLAPAYAYRGIILLRFGKTKEAEQDFETAFRLDGKLRTEIEPYINQVRAMKK